MSKRAPRLRKWSSARSTSGTLSILCSSANVEKGSLSASTTSCVQCASDHVLAVKALKEVSTDKHQSDQTLHPWRYSEKGEDGGLPF
jgi:hypothetical protein